MAAARADIPEESTKKWPIRTQINVRAANAQAGAPCDNSGELNSDLPQPQTAELRSDFPHSEPQGIQRRDIWLDGRFERLYRAVE